MEVYRVMNDNSDKHDIHIENTGQRNEREQHRFAEVELEVTEQQEKNAVSRVVTPDSWERTLDWQGDFSYVSREGQFVQRARELESQAVDHADFVPFQTYWPTYDQMQPGQINWYLYWRGEVRSGRYPDTDLSYLFVYLYELIHGIGWSEPALGFELIDRVWRAYRKRYPKLDLYVREWQYDFALVFGLDMSPAEPLHKLPRSLSPELKELEWKRRFTAESLELTWDMLLMLSDYDIEKSRYYSQQGRKELREYVPKVVALVDGYLAKTAGTKLIDLYRPREKKVTRYLFRSAVYNHDQYGRTATVTLLPISEHLPLRSYLTHLVRFTENKLRELTGFKGKLRGIQIEPEVEQLISRFLNKEFEIRKAEEAKARLPKVKINATKLRKLQHESDEVRDMLLTEPLSAGIEERGAPGESPVPPMSPGRATSLGNPVSQAKPGQGSLRKRKVVDGPEQAELDFERGWQVFEEEPSASAGREGWKADEKAEERDNPEDIIQPEVSLGAATIEVLLETSQEVTLLETPEDDQCIESSEDDEAAGGMELPEEWRELLLRLSGPHKKMLSALLDGEGDGVRHDIAEQTGSMPELLLDEINELSMEWIGDLLIDGDEIVEEYRYELRDLLRGGC